MIPTRVHGVLDYIVGLALIAAPWLFGFAYNGPGTWVPVVLGISIIVYSLMTAYELGLAPIIKMVPHLWLDGIGGAFLAASPWLLGYADIVWIPHVLVGVVEVTVAVATRTQPRYVRAVARP
ncbi:MAG: SPW repeat protein [Planctomycetota bacterium]|nr:SPW repeat protein [Planctomycetota bacterium]